VRHPNPAEVPHQTQLLPGTRRPSQAGPLVPLLTLLLLVINTLPATLLLVITTLAALAVTLLLVIATLAALAGWPAPHYAVYGCAAATAGGCRAAHRCCRPMSFP